MTDNTKPRRWKLRIFLRNGEVNYSVGGPLTHSAVDVIELSAYDALEAELTALKKQIDEAPWVFSPSVHGTYFQEYASRFEEQSIDGPYTHRAKLIGLEKL